MAGRVKTWTGWEGSVAVGAAAAKNSVTILPASDPMMKKGCTLIRIRGWLKLQPTSVPGGQQVGAVGIIQMTTFSAAAARPDPGAEFNADWLFWTGYVAGSLSGTVVSENTSHIIEVDNKAMRKLDERKEIRLVVSNQFGVPIDCYGILRMLCLEG